MNEPSAHPAAAGEPVQTESIYWRRTVRLTLVLLALWFGVTFTAAFYADAFDFTLFGWPFSFWFGAQGALLMFLGIVCLYVWRMEKLEAGPDGHPDDAP